MNNCYKSCYFDFNSNVMILVTILKSKTKMNKYNHQVYLVHDDNDINEILIDRRKLMHDDLM
jgi:hypothetical protein